VSNQPSQELELASEFETSIQTTFRVLNLGWMMISFFVALSLVYLSGAPYHEVILYALGAPIAYFSTSWIKHGVLSQFRLIPVVVYCLCLPILVGEKAVAPWISIGLIAATGALTSMIFKSFALSVLYVVVCCMIQLYIANLKLAGVSDSTDTLLLGGYFSTIWVLLLGIGSTLLVRNYLNYAKKMDETFGEISEEYWERSQSISRINLKDYLNLKLHGTILNTLIVAQKMPGIASKEAISRQLKEEILQLEQHEEEITKQLPLNEIIPNQVNFGRLKVAINHSPELDLRTLELDLIIELIREVALNINRHTDSDHITITIGTKDDKEILLTILEELTKVTSEQELESRASAAMASKSLMRLSKYRNATYSVNSYPTGALLHLIHIEVVNQDLDILSRAKKIRAESLSVFVRNLSLIPSAFAVLAIPGFILLDVSLVVILILVSTVAMHLLLLRESRANLAIRFVAAFLPLTIFPYTYLNLDGCANLYSLPWVVNAFLGALLFGAYSSTSLYARWLPGFLMVLCCGATFFVLPKECSTLLNGTTPGIFIVLIMARYLMSFRNRNFKLDLDLDRNLKALSLANAVTWERISGARIKVISKVRHFAEEKSSPNGSSEIGRLINYLRCYLLCSEKFDKDFYSDFFDWISDRYERGLDTSLEIYEYEGLSLTSTLKFQEIFKFVDDICPDSNMHILINSSNSLNIELLTEERVPIELAMRANKVHPAVVLKFGQK
jgi:hypothetical protein